ncbi:MAG: hypothetical protein KDJ65_35775 [Anaerolineae bacterium]|nr:hypothetical protein [Anaerolineae bacterium]
MKKLFFLCIILFFGGNVMLSGCNTVSTINSQQLSETATVQLLSSNTETTQPASLPVDEQNIETNASSDPVASKQEDTPLSASEAETDQVISLSETDLITATVIPSDIDNPEGLFEEGQDSIASNDPSAIHSEPFMVDGATPVVEPFPSTDEQTFSPAEIYKEVDWLLFHDETFGYRLQYPSTYVTVNTEQQLEPTPLSQIYFFNQRVVANNAVAQEISDFSIVIFENTEQLPLEQWLKKHRLADDSKNFTIENYELAGSEALRVISAFNILPNNFVYISKDKYIFKLVPVGEFAEQMLSTFEFDK